MAPYALDAAEEGRTVELIERRREDRFEHMLVILIEQHVDAVEQDLVEHPPNMVRRVAIRICVVCGEFDGHADEAFGLLDIGIEVLQLTSAQRWPQHSS